MELRIVSLLSLSLIVWVSSHSQTFKDHVLVNEKYLVRRFKAGDWMHCILSCQEDTKCLSYNYQYEQRTNGLCELYRCLVEHNKDIETSLVYSFGFLFQQLKRTTGAEACCRKREESSHCKPQGHCKKNWIQHGSSCFLPVTQRLTWSKSQDNCNTLGGNLTSIQNQDENKFIVGLGDEKLSHIHEYFWIGLKKTGGEYSVWEDGTTVDYDTDWQNNEPDDKLECVNAYIIEKKWKTHRCNQENPSICRYSL